MKEQKYRLGNRDQEYELKEDYLGWLPEPFDSWDSFLFSVESDRSKTPVAFSIRNTKNETETHTLILHQAFIKDAFPLSFFGEERAQEWNNFAIVSRPGKPEQFIIPLV